MSGTGSRSEGFSLTDKSPELAVWNGRESESQQNWSGRYQLVSWPKQSW